jgi:hypothetical protein
VRSKDAFSFTNNWQMPSPYPVVKTETVKLGEINIEIPVEGDQCWANPLPCSPYIKKGLQIRGYSLREGFRIDQNSNKP